MQQRHIIEALKKEHELNRRVIGELFAYHKRVHDCDPLNPNTEIKFEERRVGRPPYQYGS